MAIAAGGSSLTDPSTCASVPPEPRDGFGQRTVETPQCGDQLITDALS